MNQHWTISARVGRDGVVGRRDFVRILGAGAGLATLGWRDRVLADAPELRKKGKSIIMLWMQGGPSQFETFDPKPDSDTKSIATAVPGIEVCEFWPNVAKAMKDITLIRSMTNREGNHIRATYQMHTGYMPSGSVKHPAFGSFVTHELAPADFELPGFVSILGPSQGSGFLPVNTGPFRIANPSQMPPNSQVQSSTSRFNRRLGLLDKLETGYAKAGAQQQVDDHKALYRQAANLSLSPKLKAFDLTQESEKTRTSYGSTPFGQGCLLARRLVEAGVTFVEVQLGNWDTHQDNNERVKALADQCDPAFAALLADLKQRRMLDDTLVVWMGEFGRTPRINPAGGRDHFPVAFNAAVAGGGMPGGKVVGKTSADGSSIVDTPVTINDLFNTFCHKLGVNPGKEFQSPVGRPLKIVDGGKPIEALS